jgi:hypothetical protein
LLHLVETFVKARRGYQEGVFGDGHSGVD